MKPADSNAHHIKLVEVCKTYGKITALNGVSMHVQQHEVLGLIGENGAGKSTLLKLLGGVQVPDGGKIFVNGNEHALHSPIDAARAGIGVVHQEQSLIDSLSVAENVAIGLLPFSGQAGCRNLCRLGIFNRAAVEEECAAALSQIGFSIPPWTLVGSLSFAEKQMVEIARAVRIATRSGIQPMTILDEPTSVLDKPDIDKLEDEIQRLKSLGSVVFVSHRLDEIRRNCDRIYILRSGTVVGNYHTSEIDDDSIFYLMTGRTKVVRHASAQLASTSASQVLKLEAASSAGHFEGVNLEVNAGQVHVLIGTQNSGREALGRAVFGAHPIDRGRMLLAGEVAHDWCISKAVSYGVGYVPSERKLEGMIAGMSVSENLLLTHPDKATTGPFVRPQMQKSVARSWVDKLDVRPASTDLDISRLSGGNQQKIVLAKWAKAPGLKLLVLDHPTRGVDPGARERINDVIEELCQRGVGILLLADSLDEALMIGDTISVMRDGVVSATFNNRGDKQPELSELVRHMI